MTCWRLKPPLFGASGEVRRPLVPIKEVVERPARHLRHPDAGDDQLTNQLRLDRGDCVMASAGVGSAARTQFAGSVTAFSRGGYPLLRMSRSSPTPRARRTSPSCRASAFRRRSARIAARPIIQRRAQARRCRAPFAGRRSRGRPPIRSSSSGCLTRQPIGEERRAPSDGVRRGSRSPADHSNDRGHLNIH
jgi:hypothetical protein